MAALLKEVGPKPADGRDKIGEIDFAMMLQPGFQVRRGDPVDHLAHPLLCGVEIGVHGCSRMVPSLTLARILFQVIGRDVLFKKMNGPRLRHDV